MYEYIAQQIGQVKRNDYLIGETVIRLFVRFGGEYMDWYIDLGRNSTHTFGGKHDI